MKRKHHYYLIFDWIIFRIEKLILSVEIYDNASKL